MTSRQFSSFVLTNCFMSLQPSLITGRLSGQFTGISALHSGHVAYGIGATGLSLGVGHPIPLRPDSTSGFRVGTARILLLQR